MGDVVDGCGGEENGVRRGVGGVVCVLDWILWFDDALVGDFRLAMANSMRAMAAEALDKAAVLDRRVV